MRIVIKGGQVIDPATGIDEQLDVLIEGETISAVDKPGAFSSVEGARAVEAKGKIVCPGLCDMHVHLREPGQEWKGTVESETRALAAGGMTACCCMPNTNPRNDHAEVTQYILEKARQAGSTRVYPYATITVGSEGKALSPMHELREAGAVAFTDDGRPVADAGVMRRALEYASMLDAVLAVHEEDLALSDNFSMNESAMSIRLGLRGMPGAAEDVMIARDIEIARLTRGRVHFCHVSTGRAVTLIRRAKEDGIPVTAEVTPQNFTLTEEAIGSEYNTFAKMSMPLRSQADVEALIEGVADGTIDAIASDHAPHEKDSKEKEFEAASFGVIGAQTTLALSLARVRQGRWTMKRVIEALSVSPRKCLKLPQVSIAKGQPADITIIDAKRSITFTPEINLSKSANGVFWGWDLEGLAVRTFVGGREVFDFERDITPRIGAK